MTTVKAKDQQCRKSAQMIQRWDIAKVYTLHEESNRQISEEMKHTKLNRILLKYSQAYECFGQTTGKACEYLTFNTGIFPDDGSLGLDLDYSYSGKTVSP